MPHELGTCMDPDSSPGDSFDNLHGEGYVTERTRTKVVRIFLEFVRMSSPWHLVGGPDKIPWKLSPASQRVQRELAGPYKQRSSNTGPEDNFQGSGSEENIFDPPVDKKIVVCPNKTNNKTKMWKILNCGFSHFCDQKLDKINLAVFQLGTSFF